ncbi:MAG: dihydrofolate reductase [Candidatus Omnitrophica bacterium]|nr:dihydrofolate reductase [Candidatus Omnitrophota bacterium]
MFDFNIVVAIDSKNGIGKNGQLPWRLPSDLKRFKEITTQTKSPQKKNVVIMGRVTWDSLPASFRPLPNRTNIVLTRNSALQLPGNVIRVDSFNQVQDVLGKMAYDVETVFVIGGQQIFQESLKSSYCKKLYITHIVGDYHCDTFFPAFNDQFVKISSEPPKIEQDIKYFFAEYQRKT